MFFHVAPQQGTKTSPESVAQREASTDDMTQPSLASAQTLAARLVHVTQGKGN
jgi:hypothetical protein